MGNLNLQIWGAIYITILTMLKITDTLNIGFTFRKNFSKGIWKYKGHRRTRELPKKANKEEQLREMDSFERYISLPKGEFQCAEGIRMKGRFQVEEQERHQSLGPFQILGFPQFRFPLLFSMYVELTFCVVS